MRNYFSYWSKWDLHVHTPASYVHNYRGTNQWEEFIDDLEALSPEFKVLGINDYLTFEGYERILDYKSKGRLKNIEMFLPVIEMRLSTLVGSQAQQNRINYHVIFSDELSVAELNDFLTRLVHPGFKLLGFDGKERQWRASPSRENLIKLGEIVKEGASPEQRTQMASSLEEGFKNLNYPVEEIEKALSTLVGKYLIGLGKTEWELFRTGEAGHASKVDLITKADLLFTAAPTILLWQKSHQKLTEQNIRNKLLDCSDAHNYSHSAQSNRIGNCNMWVKAEPTFEGLRLALHEYGERTFCGTTPEKLALSNLHRTKYIKSLKFGKLHDSNLDEQWFKGELLFSTDLVAIIGNKGSGKSALADSLGLLGNSTSQPYFSFLNQDKFCNAKNNKGANFRATITWRDGTEKNMLLSDLTNSAIPELIKYLPQKYLDVLCEEQPGAGMTQFEFEIQKVIFTHVAVTDRSDCSSLSELLALRTKQVEEQLGNIQFEMTEVNRQIIETEAQLEPNYRELLSNQLEQKNLELNALFAAEPIPVVKPLDLPINSDLSGLQAELRTLRAVQRLHSDRMDTLNRDIRKAVELEHRIGNFKDRFNEFLQNNKPDAEYFGLQLLDLISISTNSKILLEQLAHLRLEKTAIEIMCSDSDGSDIEFSLIDLNNAYCIVPDEPILNSIQDGRVEANEESLESNFGNEVVPGIESQIRRIEEQIQEKQLELDLPAQKYQQYLTDYQVWLNMKANIQGSHSKPDTIEFYKSEIASLSKLPQKLTELKLRRSELCQNIFSCYEQLKSEYIELFAPVQQFIDTHSIAKNRLKLEFAVSLIEAGFENQFFEKIHRGIAGSFVGNEEGSKKLKELLASTDFNQITDTIKFVNQILHLLQNDDRSKASVKRRVEDQLRKNVSKIEVYNFLFSLPFLRPSYSLKLAGKNLKELSPGERGLLLLVFYLLIDQGDVPLIIDQPEENLDNQTIFELLVPCIKEAKKRRQVFIVTHNPNLAVVCDAEQVIHCNIEKHKRNKVSYTSGPIENPQINRMLLDILEGTEPAFNNRNFKYYKDRSKSIQ